MDCGSDPLSVDELSVLIFPVLQAKDSLPPAGGKKGIDFPAMVLNQGGGDRKLGNHGSSERALGPPRSSEHDFAWCKLFMVFQFMTGRHEVCRVYRA